ncbi:MAG: glutamate--tRNA ligase [Pseudomonadota bacterium]
MTKPVVTRFAPSPTGYLHIGGARTALFNWLYAKANDGEMMLRIEDTDRERSDEKAVAAILDGLSWLGLGWHGEPVSQFSGADRHREVAEELLAKGAAYRCYSTPDELAVMREAAKAEGHSTAYNGMWRDKDLADAPPGAPFVVRLKTPLDGHTVVHDQVQGEVRFPNADLEDFVMLRSDGTPTYMLAVVVDDFDMGVSHIIRGDDHLTNAAKQTLIFEAMGWDVPIMAHIPLIHGADGGKLSKRHGAIGAEAYRAMGYIPEALRNYLVRLGWAHGDEEIFTTQEMIKAFGFDGMNKAAARFDFAKLEALNAHYMRQMAPDTLLQNLIDLLPELEGGAAIAEALDDQNRNWLLAALPSLTERAKTLVELVEAADFVFAARPLEMDEKALSLTTGEGQEVIRKVLPVLEALDDWSHDGIDAALRGFCESQDLKLGKVAQPIRAALTGKAASPGAFDVLQIFGKTEALARLSDRI